MAKGVNKVILVGNLGQDPEQRFTSGGNPVTTLSIATSESWKDQSGAPQERTEWHKVVLWKKLAEIAIQYLRKGSQVYIEGKLQTRKWQDQNGQDRYSTEIVANNMQMLGGRQDSAAQGSGYQSQPAQQPAAQQPQKQGGYNQSNSYATASGGSNARTPPPQQSGPAPEPDFDFDDDIPF